VTPEAPLDAADDGDSDDIVVFCAAER